MAAAERRGVLANDYPHSPLARPEFIAHGIRHAMAQPLIIGDRVRGVVTMSRSGDDAEPFQPDDLPLLESFAAQAAIALENARLYHAAETRAARLRTLSRLNHLVTSSLDPGQVLSSIAEAAAEIVHAPFVAFWLADEDTRTLRMQGLRDTSSGTGENIDELRFGEGAVGWVAAERRPLAIADIHADGRFVARDWARSRGFHSLYAAPLLDQTRLLGVLVLIGERPFRFSPDDEDLLQSFSAQAAAAIRNARLYEETRRYAERLRALEEVNRLVSSSLNVEEVLQNLARAIAQFFDAPFVSIWAFDAGAQRLRRALTFGDQELAAELHDDLALGRGGGRLGGAAPRADHVDGDGHRSALRRRAAAERPRPALDDRVSHRHRRPHARRLRRAPDRDAGRSRRRPARSWARWPPRPPSDSRTRGSTPRRAGGSPRRARCSRWPRSSTPRWSRARCSSESRSRWPRCAGWTAARSSCGTATR